MFPGQKLHFDDVVALSGYRNVVTTNSPPEVYVQDRPTDAVVVVSCIRHYLRSGPTLPSDEVERSREILERLTILDDWAAGEIIGRQRRDEERHRTGYFDIKPRLTPLQMLALRVVRKNPGASLAAIADATGAHRLEAKRVVAELLEDGLLVGDMTALQVTPAEKLRYERALAELQNGIRTDHAKFHASC